MTVYLLINDCPSDFGDMQLLAVFSNEKSARMEKDRLQEKDPYAWQYLEIFKRKVRE